MAKLMPPLVTHFDDDNGNPLVGGKVFFYEAGTSTPKNTFTDANSGIPNPNPVVLNARGDASIWLTAGEPYKAIIKRADDSVVRTVDFITRDAADDAAYAALESAEAARDVAIAQAGIATAQAVIATEQRVLSEAGRVGSEAARTGAEDARDAALLSRGVFASTADALSKGVNQLSITGNGSGGTSGAGFKGTFTGGGGTAAEFSFTVAGGAIVPSSVFITASGKNYTSAPTGIDVSASAGLTGVTFTAGIGFNVSVGEYFSVPQVTSTFIDFYRVDAGPVAVKVNSFPAKAYFDAIFPDGFNFRSGYTAALVDSVGKMWLSAAINGDVGVGGPSGLLVSNNINPRSGYILALSGLLNALAIGFKADGTTVFSNRTELVAGIGARSGYAIALLDALNRIGFAVTKDGQAMLEGRYPMREIDVLKSANAENKFIKPLRDLVFIGDSLTAGAGGQTTWREQLPAMLTGDARASTNYAIGGQTSSQIAARMGGIYTFLTITSNTIPASGPVAVTARTIALLTNQGDQSITGTLYGVAGTLARAGDDSYSFTRTTAGSTVYVPPETPFVPDVLLGDAPFATTFIFIGRNDILEPETVKVNIRRMVEWLKSQDRHFIVLTPTNGGPTDASTPSGEGVGSTVYNNCVNIERWAEDAYGELAFNVRKYSLQFGNGSTGDNLDISNGVVPRSLRIDFVHYTTAFNTQIATKVAEIINRKEW